MLYHGTTWRFDSFDIGKSKELNFIGDGVYFTSSESDAHENYACVGPDLKMRLWEKIDDIMMLGEDQDEPTTKTEAIIEAANEMIGEHSLVLQCEFIEECRVLVIDSNNPIYFDMFNMDFDGDSEEIENTEEYNNIIGVFESLGVDYEDFLIDSEISALDIFKFCRKHFEGVEYQNLFVEVVCALGYDAVRFVNIGEFLHMYYGQKHDHIIVFNKDMIRIVDVHDNETNTRQEYLEAHNVCVSC